MLLESHTFFYIHSQSAFGWNAYKGNPDSHINVVERGKVF